MNILKRIKKYHESDFRKNNIQTKKWFFFRWEAALIIFATLAVALLNILPNWIGDAKEVSFAGGDRYIPNSLRDNLIFSSISVGLTLILAIFIGVYTEIGKYAGKYSSALFVLVPGLVWLFSARSDSHIEHIMNMSKYLGSMIFWTTVAIASLYAIVTTIKHVAVVMVLADRTKERIEMWYNVFNRVNIVIINILIMIMMSYGLINYAVFTLHLCDRTPQELAENSKLPPYNLEAGSFVTFHAVIAIFFAVLMVAIGLTNIIVADVAVAVDPEEAELDPTMKTVGDIEDEAHQRVHEQFERGDDDV